MAFLWESVMEKAIAVGDDGSEGFRQYRSRERSMKPASINRKLDTGSEFLFPYREYALSLAARGSRDLVCIRRFDPLTFTLEKREHCRSR
jgi:hypothetical protein